MAREIKTMVYEFDELSETAKEKAIVNFRSSTYFEDDCVIEDLGTIANLIGITFDTYAVKFMDGTFREDPKIYYSLTYCQWDYAGFVGAYQYKKDCVKNIKNYTPKDAELNRIVKAIAAEQKKHFYKLSARINCDAGFLRVDTDSDVLNSLLQDFAKWMYTRLIEEYEYQMSDEQLIDCIQCNGYEFDINGIQI